MGFLDDAGVDAEKVSDKVYNFGNGLYPVLLREVKEAKLTKSQDKFGAMVECEIMSDKYSTVRPFQIWIQLPMPVAYGSFDAENDPEDARVAREFKAFLYALGFEVKDMNKVGPDEMAGKLFATRLSEEDGDFGVQIRFRHGSAKRMPEPGSDGMNQFDTNASGKSSGSKKESAEERMRREMEAESGE